VAEERLLWEDLNPGDEAVSLNRTVTEADIVNFCGVSGDFNWFHIDDVKAKESVFGQRVAHGMLVTSIATGLQVEKMEPKIATAAFVVVQVNVVPLMAAPCASWATADSCDVCPT